MNEKIVLVFDICSSTHIIEDLHRQQTTSLYKELIASIQQYLKNNSDKYNFEIYKFRGDGFILLFDATTLIDQVLIFTIGLTNECDKYLTDFIEEYVEDTEIPRKGITIGLAKGFIEELELDEESPIEYIGRPITVACRLQDSLNKPEHTNRVLMELKLHTDIENEALKMICTRTSRSLRNINKNRNQTYYEFDPIYYKKQNIERLRKPAKDKVQKILVGDSTVRGSTQELFIKATSAYGPAQTIATGDMPPLTGVDIVQVPEKD